MGKVENIRKKHKKPWYAKEYFKLVFISEILWVYICKDVPTTSTRGHQINYKMLSACWIHVFL